MTASTSPHRWLLVALGVAALLGVIVPVTVFLTHRGAREPEPTPLAFSSSASPLSPTPTGDMVHGDIEYPEYWLAVGQEYRFDAGDFEARPVLVTVQELGVREDNGREFADVQFSLVSGERIRLRFYLSESSNAASSVGGGGQFGAVVTRIRRSDVAASDYVSMGARASQSYRPPVKSSVSPSGRTDLTLDYLYGGKGMTSPDGLWYVAGNRAGPASMQLTISLTDQSGFDTSAELYRGDSVHFADLATVTLLDYSEPPRSNDRLGGGAKGTVRVHVHWEQ